MFIYQPFIIRFALDAIFIIESTKDSINELDVLLIVVASDFLHR